ncbi:hypothetical protein ABL78_0744 [Leptomonas seymouri]|uniref:WW domain-containing protein n=1 Tax=Leptomonas seymouri TaxID=5684 RepID=A0A0N0P8M1_LEPSE|nr:hypothetical protein ABL78_0744 [Leptomonas seymouri]|eukprot:KPI90099.1 hypothetical protein ABL78_0744 [Leptomonas seymouri]
MDVTLPDLMDMPASFISSQWICRKDPRTQRTYYVNRRTGRSTWDPVHQTAIDTEQDAVTYQAVVPALRPLNLSVKPPSPKGMKDLSATSQGATMTSSAPERNSTGSGSGGGNDKKEAPTLPLGSMIEGSEANVKHAAEKDGAAPAPPIISSSSSDATALQQQQRQHAQPLLSCEHLKLTPFTAAPTLPAQAPLSPSAALLDGADVADTTPLGVLLASRRRSPSEYVKHGSDFLTAPTSASAPPPDTGTWPPVDHTTFSSSKPSRSPVERRPVLAEDSPPSSALHQTQRPREMPSLLTQSSRQSHLPPALSLASLAAHPAAPTAQGQTLDDASATGTTDSAIVTASASDGALLSSPPSIERQPQPHALLLLQDGSFDPEEVATQELYLTQRIWELEAERARLKSELAVLRGPTEVETQSIAEDHDRLLEAQQALASAATLAVNQQKTKREELDRLRERFSELRELRDHSKFFISVLQDRLALVQGRCRKVQGEEEQLRQRRRELEEVFLPSEEASLRDVQSRLYNQRQWVAVQQRQLEERTHALTRGRDEVQRLKDRLDELAAIPHDKGSISGREERTSSSLIPQKEARVPKERCLSLRSADGALAVPAAEPEANRTEHGTELQTRIAELQRDIFCFQSSSRALYENRLLTVQQQLLREWTQRLHGETEAWRPALGEASAVLRSLKQFYKTQLCKYGVSATAT